MTSDINKALKRMEPAPNSQ